MSWCETAFVLNDNVELKISAHFNEFVNINGKKLNVIWVIVKSFRFCK